jgi:Flp pilus assembly protein TadG
MGWISRLRRGARFWRKDKSGSTAIEFGMVIGPFMGLLFAIIEVALVYFAQFAMESGNEKASRILRTGEAQNGNMTAAQFKARVCSKLPAFMDCNANLIVDVRSYTDTLVPPRSDAFAKAAADMPDLFDADGVRTGNADKFCPGGANAVVLVTLYYKWNLIMGMPGLGDFTGKMGLSLGNMPDGSRMIITGFVMKNEPYTLTGTLPTAGC